MSLFAQQYGSCPSHVLGIESLAPNDEKAGIAPVGVVKDRVSPISATLQSTESSKMNGQEVKTIGILGDFIAIMAPNLLLIDSYGYQCSSVGND